MAKILIVDDHEIVRNGIRGMLTNFDDFVIVGEAESGEEALEKVQQLSPDVVLMDVFMSGLNGIETTRLITQQYPNVRVIALTAHADDVFPRQVLKAGAIGYVTKHVNVAEMLKAIRMALRGRRYLESSISEKMIEDNLTDNPFNLLSRREKQIAILVVQGYSYQEIAQKLHVAVTTVNTHRYRAFDKLADYNVDSDVKLTRLAIQYGFDKVNLEDI